MDVPILVKKWFETPKSPDGKPYTHKCPHCKKYFSSKGAALAHMRENHPAYFCNS
jgi:hypothetical protein